MKTVLRWSGRLLGLAILLAGVAAIGLYWRMHSALPQTEGIINLRKLNDQAKIARDSHGIAHIFASNRHDMFYALGVAHAQDRMFQMDMSRRFGSGRLAELVGKRALAVDARMRTLGLRRAAEGSWKHLTASEQAAIQAYADGVNAVILAKGYVPPIEYAVLGARPQEWLPADTLTVFKVMAYNLSGDAFDEPGRKRLREILGPQKLAQFLAPYPADAPVALRAEDMTSVFPSEADNATAASPVLGPALGEQPKGSNNWVVDGSLSASGKPMLANDPHLGLTAPGIWYFARLNAPDAMVLGVTLPGTPFVTLGRNRVLAWGFTNTGPDTSDLFVRDTKNLKTRTIKETIHVKGEDDVTLNISFAHGGVILPPKWFPKATKIAKADQSVILVSTLDDDDDTTASIGLADLDARSIAQMDKALARFKMPEQNMVFADTAGNIGFVAPARVPVRDANGEWVGEIPYEALPRTFNPGRHYVATANNKIVPDSYPYFITSHWYGASRIRRIVGNLEATRKHDAASFKAMQMDTVSDLARKALPLISAAQPKTQKGTALQKMLASWDGNLAPTRPEGLVYDAWMKQFSKLVYADDLGQDFERFWTPRRLFMEGVVRGPYAAWCDDVNTSDTETCQMMAARAFDDIAPMLVRQYGDDPQAWRWGKAHQAIFKHPLFGEVPLLRNLFNVRVPVGGDGSTPNVAHISYQAGNFDSPWGPSMRAIYDLSNLNASLFMTAPGQSGQLLSPHYRDMAKAWAKGEYFEIRDDWTPDSPPPGTKVLTLKPQ